MEFLENKNIATEFQHLPQYDKLVEIVSQSRPQQEAENNQEYNELKSEIDILIDDHVSKEKREWDRENLIRSLLESKVMFKDDLEEFALIVEQNDWGEEEAKNSEHYRDRISNKALYVQEINSRIRPIKMSD